MRILVLPALTLAACTPTAAEQARIDDRAAVKQTELDKALAGLKPGKTASCLPLSGSNQGQISAYGPTILYRYSRGLVYRTDTNGGCEGIARGDILVTRQFGTRTCSGDIATTVDNVARFQTGSCSFGQFTVYRRR